MLTSKRTKRDSARQVILEHIKSGQWRPGARLPSQNDLASNLQVSTAPVRQALAKLVEEGVIESLPGKQGLFVSEQEDTVSGIVAEPVVIAYEGSKYHPELEGTQLHNQLWAEELTMRAWERGIRAQAVPFPPMDPHSQEDDQALEIFERHKWNIFLDPSYVPWAKYLEAKGVHAIFVVPRLRRGLTDWVCWDRHTAIELLVQHLVESGHQQVGYLGAYNRWHLTSYLDHLRQHGLTLNGEHIEPADGHSRRVGYESALHMLDRLGAEHMPTGLVVDTDCKAIGVLDAFRERGLDVPGHISVVSLDRRPIAAEADPPLTSAGPDWDGVCNTVLDEIEAVNHSERPVRIQETVPPRLDVRQSSGAPRG